MDLQHWSKQNGATIQNGKITHRIEIVGNHVHSSAVTNREVHIVHACATGCCLVHSRSRPFALLTLPPLLAAASFVRALATAASVAVLQLLHVLHARV